MPVGKRNTLFLLPQNLSNEFLKDPVLDFRGLIDFWNLAVIHKSSDIMNPDMFQLVAPGLVLLKAFETLSEYANFSLSFWKHSSFFVV